MSDRASLAALFTIVAAAAAVPCLAAAREGELPTGLSAETVPLTILVAIAVAALGTILLFAGWRFPRLTVGSFLLAASSAICFGMLAPSGYLVAALVTARDIAFRLLGSRRALGAAAVGLFATIGLWGFLARGDATAFQNTHLTSPPGYRADAFVSIHADGAYRPGVRGWKMSTPSPKYAWCFVMANPLKLFIVIEIKKMLHRI